MRKLSVLFLVVVMSVMMVVPAFAQDYGGHDGPSFDTVDESYLSQYPYASVFYSSETLTMLLTPEPFYNNTFDKFYLTSGNKVTGVRLKLSEDGTTWVYLSDCSGSYVSLPFIWANYDINYPDGTLYLKGWTPPKILAEEIIDLAGDTINNDTVPSVSSAMTILGVTGIGLLAMLVLLKLFGKRSLIHR